VNDTLAAVAVVGVTVYLRFPHPVAGVLAVTDCQVPANASIDTVGVVVVGVGVVGVVELSLFGRRSQPAAASEAAKSTTRTNGRADDTPRAALVPDFMFLLIVTYDFLL
jgi:hypothetical protein